MAHGQRQSPSRDAAMANGSVTRRGESWRARYTHPETGKRHQRTFRRQVDAQRWLRSQLDALDRGSWVDPQDGRITFSSYFAAWSQHQVWTDGTVKAMSLAARDATFRDLELRKSPPDSRRGVGEGDVSPRARARHGQDAVRQRPVGVPGGDPRQGDRGRPDRGHPAAPPAQARGLDADPDPGPGARDPRGRRRAVRRLRRCLRVRRPPARRGRRAASSTTSTSCAASSTSVARSSVSSGGRSRSGSRSTDRSATCPCPTTLLTILSQHVELGHRGDWLFAGERTTHRIRTRSATGGARRSRPRSGGIRLHDLRHFYASGLIAAGCDVVTVQRALGHSKATTTLETYAHLWPSAEDKTRKAAATLAEEVLAPDGGKTGARGG